MDQEQYKICLLSCIIQIISLMAWLHQRQEKSEAEVKVEGMFSCSVCPRKEDRNNISRLSLIEKVRRNGKFTFHLAVSINASTVYVLKFEPIKWIFHRKTCVINTTSLLMNVSTHVQFGTVFSSLNTRL